MELHGTELQLLTNYLQNRKQYVIFNNHESDLTEITTGVPQGSILGPLLFSIIINDLKKSSEKLRFLMYADDTTLIWKILIQITMNMKLMWNCKKSVCG